MKLVNDILSSKGNDIWRVAPDDSVLNAIKIMAQKGVGALLVMNDEDLVGIISERDYARKIILNGRSSEKTPVRDIMSTGIISAQPEQSIEECMRIVTENRIRHLPVMQDKKVVGVLSIGDLVKAIIEEQHDTIKQLEMYITG